MMLALAGLLLIIRDLVSDIVGILLLQPWLRNMLADKLIGSNQFRMQMGASRLASSRLNRAGR